MEKEKEQVNHPSHYNREGRKECIVEMREKFGDMATEIFCILNAFKYDYRAGAKGDAETDRQKSEWYRNYARELHKITSRYTLNALCCLANGPGIAVTDEDSEVSNDD